jgi:hypothetical protein
MAHLTVVFEADDSRTELAPSHISRLCDDPASWWSVMRVLAGHGDFATMTVRANQGGEEVQTRMAVHFEQPPWNWKFPDETA